MLKIVNKYKDVINHSQNCIDLCKKAENSHNYEQANIYEKRKLDNCLF